MNWAPSILRCIAGVFVAAISGPLGNLQAADLSDARPPDSVATDPVAVIDAHLRKAWDEQGIRPAREATAGEWCRRVYLDIIGRIPTVEEVETFFRSREADRKRHLVERLLGDEYAQEYARQWSSIWTNILIGRTGGQGGRTLTSRAGMQAYLSDSFAYNKPYHTMVYELVSARGSTRMDAEDFNGATNFLVGKLAEDGVQATAKTAQIFLGVQVQCTQCHNHPFNEHKQNQFWELNAFFRQTVALRSFDGRMIANVRLDDQDFAGEGGDPLVADIYYEMRNGRVGQAFPTFIDGTSLAGLFRSRNAAEFVDEQGNVRAGEEFGNSGYLAHINRREELAKLVVGSEYLERAIVSRMWAHFLGYGFTKPVDDMGPHNASSHPELFEALATRFRREEFDLKKLIRWVVLSEPYSLSSRMTKQHAALDNPEVGTRPYFSHFYVRQIEAEQLYESLLTATAADATIAGDDREAAKERWLSQFSQAFGTDEGDESTTFDGSIPQSLMMMNGELMRQACGTERGSFLYRVATDDSLSNRKRIDYLYLAALARRPAGDEIAAANQLLAQRKGNTAAALQDVWWALLNSNEFILNH